MSPLLWLALACDTGSVPSDPPDPPAPHRSLAQRESTPLPAPLLLRRISLDLRGTLPSLAELAQVEADPAALDGLVAEMLDDPRLEEVIHQIVLGKPAGHEAETEGGRFFEGVMTGIGG